MIVEAMVTGFIKGLFGFSGQSTQKKKEEKPAKDTDQKTSDAAKKVIQGKNPSPVMHLGGLSRPVEIEFDHGIYDRCMKEKEDQDRRDMGYGVVFDNTEPSKESKSSEDESRN